MTQNSFENIQIYFCEQRNEQIDKTNSFMKQQQASTFVNSKDKKLWRNKISAQNSRLKKKQFIENLQQNQRDLAAQIEKTERQIEKAKTELNILLTKTKQNDSFNHDEKSTYQRLKHLIRQQQNVDEDQVNMLIELLINRVGVTGKQRRRMIEYYSKRLVNFSIPAMYRYLLKASTVNEGLLSDSNKNIFEWDKDLYQKLELTEKQRQKFHQKKIKMLNQKNQWMQKIKSFNKTCSEIYQESGCIEKQLLNIKDLLTIKQTGQIIVSIQNRKYNRDIYLGKEIFTNQKKRYREEHNIQSIEQNDVRENGNSCKKTKLNQQTHLLQQYREQLKTVNQDPNSKKKIQIL